MSIEEHGQPMTRVGGPSDDDDLDAVQAQLRDTLDGLDLADGIDDGRVRHAARTSLPVAGAILIATYGLPAVERGLSREQIKKALEDHATRVINGTDPIDHQAGVTAIRQAFRTDPQPITIDPDTIHPAFITGDTK